MKEKSYRVLYLDLDGTVRKGFDEIGRFVNCAADVEIFPEVPDILRRYRAADWKIVGITNQGGIALGLVSFENIRAGILETNKQSGGAFDQIMMCQHHPDAKDPEYALCWCRKPKYGLVIEGAHELKWMYPDGIFPPHMALFVGDRPEDEQCAAGIGIEFQPAAEWRSAPRYL